MNINHPDRPARTGGACSGSVLPRWRSPGTIVFVALVLAGCGDGGSTAPANRAPQPAVAIPDQTVQVGESAALDVSTHFTDPDGDALAYGASSSDLSVASVSTSGSTVTIAGVAKGTTEVTVTASDPAGLTATQTFTATVPNRPPLAAGDVPSQRVRVAESASLDVSAHFTDPDGDALAYGASSSDSAVASVLVSGSTVTIAGLATGTTEVTVTASDPAGLTATATITVSVRWLPPMADNEVFPGQNALTRRITAFEGMLVVFDIPTSWHGLLMKEVIMDIGVPEEHIRFDSGGLRNATFLPETRVTNFPTTVAMAMNPRDVEQVEGHDVPFVAAAGNVPGFGEGRDLWYPDDLHWNNPGALHDMWSLVFDAFATGKFILAKYAYEDENGDILPSQVNVRCGMAKEACFSVLRNSDKPGSGTSSASARLSALTFFLSQLWDDPKDIVDVLKECAIDVGEEGVDEEFGLGLVSVDCDAIRNRQP